MRISSMRSHGVGGSIPPWFRPVAQLVEHMYIQSLIACRPVILINNKVKH